MDPMNHEQRKVWSSRHKTLTELLKKRDQHANAIALFLDQHACLYASKGEGTAQPTYEDELLKDIRERTMRSYPVHTPGSSNSIVWHIWHSARIEDITMNILPQTARRSFMPWISPVQFNLPTFIQAMA